MNAPTDSSELPWWICDMYSFRLHVPVTVQPLTFDQIMDMAERVKKESDEELKEILEDMFEGDNPLHRWEDEEEVENNHRPDLPDLPF